MKRALGWAVACLCLLLSVAAHAQLITPALGSRYDNFGWTTVPYGANQINLLTPLPNANIYVCQDPANGIPCTNPLTTYSSGSLIQACPTSAQITLQGTNTCIPNADAQGNFGFWVYSGVMDVEIIDQGGNQYGPFVISVGQNALQKVAVNAPIATVQINSINNTLYAQQFPGADICAKATAAFASLASTDCGAVVHLGGSGAVSVDCANPIILPQMECSNSGSNTTRLTLDGDGMSLFADPSYTGDLVDVNTVGTPYVPVEIRNILLYGNANSVGCGIRTTDTGGFHIHDGATWYFAQGGGICVNVTSGSQSEYGSIDHWDSEFNQYQIGYTTTAGGTPSALYNRVGPNVHLGLTDIGGQCAIAPYCDQGILFQGVQTAGGIYEFGYNANSNQQFAPVVTNGGAEVYRTKFIIYGEHTSGSGIGCLFWPMDGSVTEATSAEIYNTSLNYDLCPYYNTSTGWPQQSGFGHLNQPQDTYYVNEGGGVAQWRLSIQKKKSGGWMTAPNVGGGGYHDAFAGVASDGGHDWSYQWTGRAVGTSNGPNMEADMHEVGGGATLTISATAGVITSCSFTGGNNYFNPTYTLTGGTGGSLTLSTTNGVPSGCSVAAGGTGYSSGTVAVSSTNAPVNNILYMDSTGGNATNGGNIGIGPGFMDTSGMNIAGQASGCNTAVQVIPILTIARSGSTATATLASAPSPAIASGCYFMVEGVFDKNFNLISIVGSGTFPTSTTLTYGSTGLPVTAQFLGGTLVGPLQFPQANLDVNGSFRLDSGLASATSAVGGGTTYNHLQTYAVSLTPAATAANTCVAQSFTPGTMNVTLQTSPVENILSMHPPSGALPAGMGFGGFWVNGSNGNLVVNFCNATAGSLTAPSGTYTFVGLY